ncbi:GGDEF domain-containing protein [Pseudoalteromonas luteoviolacea]|uniref:GGDEF domain-containing protein n=1 Tax=Pseudoalteromonas luteoviolacea TaxID=43657 RepID=UPI0018C86DBE|nr:GGDEF domain-containing protein [Pseudoalteromonas luteoviolacea]
MKLKERFGALTKAQPILINRYPMYAAYLLLLTSAFLCYYPIHYVMQQKYALGMAVVVVIAVLVLTAARLIQGKLSVWKCFLICAVEGAMLIYLSIQSPLISVIWLPAFLVGMFMMFPFKMACVITSGFWLVLTYLGFLQLDVELALRSAMSSCLVMMLCAVIVKTYNDAITIAESVAVKDPLTGALNRRTLVEQVELESERVSRYSQVCSIIMIDLDNFKTLNDKLGHGVGDEMLVGFVELINEYTRRNDKLFRLGGDEFMLLLPGMNEENAYAFIGRIQNLVPTKLTMDSVSLGMSFGVCEITANTSVETLLEQADKALYQNKHQRKQENKFSE